MNDDPIDLGRDSDPMDISGWFNLTYAAYIVLPRLWLEAMPREWQFKFVALLNELYDTVGWDDGHGDQYMVKRRYKGKFIKDPNADYRRGRVEYKNNKK